jgi:hypothetical protein
LFPTKGGVMIDSNHVRGYAYYQGSRYVERQDGPINEANG